jgi:hypothetical protein
MHHSDEQAIGGYGGQQLHHPESSLELEHHMNQADGQKATLPLPASTSKQELAARGDTSTEDILGLSQVNDVGRSSLEHEVCFKSTAITDNIMLRISPDPTMAIALPTIMGGDPNALEAEAQEARRLHTKMDEPSSQGSQCDTDQLDVAPAADRTSGSTLEAPTLTAQVVATIEAIEAEQAAHIKKEAELAPATEMYSILEQELKQSNPGADEEKKLTARERLRLKMEQRKQCR